MGVLNETIKVGTVLGKVGGVLFEYPLYGIPGEEWDTTYYAKYNFLEDGNMSCDCNKKLLMGSEEDGCGDEISYEILILLFDCGYVVNLLKDRE